MLYNKPVGNEETDQLGEGEDDISDTDLKVNLEPGDTLTRFALVLSGTPLNYDEIFEDIVRSGVYSEKDLDSSNAVGVLTETHVRNVLKRFSQSNAVIMDPISAGDETDNFRFAKPDGNLLAERKNPEDVTHLIDAEYDLVDEADGLVNVAEVK